MSEKTGVPVCGLHASQRLVLMPLQAELTLEELVAPSAISRTLKPHVIKPAPGLTRPLSAPFVEA